MFCRLERTYLYVTNLQGDVLSVIDSTTGQTAVSYVYDAWGKLISKSGTSSDYASIYEYNPLTYRGYIYDEETGFYYLQSRYYDPTVGRFLNADDAYPGILISTINCNYYQYCNNSPTFDFDNDGYASQRTKNSLVNKLIQLIESLIPNIYSNDFIKKEVVLCRLGTANCGITLSIGAALQSNKNALFGGMYSKGTLEVSAFLGISNYVCFAFSCGITWTKAYMKFGILLALSQGPSGVYVGACIEIAIPTWLLAVATVAVACISVYCPAIGGYVAKTIACIKSSIRIAAPIIVPFIPKLITAAA